MEGTARLFYKQEPTLSKSFTVVALPLRHVAPFNYEDHISDLLTIFEKEKAENATIVAESFGGTVALQFALRYPDRIRELILINTFPYFRRRFRFYLGWILLPLTFIKLGNTVREFFYRTVMGMDGLAKEDIDNLCECSFSHGYKTSRQRMALIKDYDVRDRLKEIKIPVTIIASRRDKLIPSVKEARLMASRFPDSHIIELPAHGHTPLVSRDFLLSEVL
jgi:pimeloyl-ACP methyl ester carboxylesterase